MKLSKIVGAVCFGVFFLPLLFVQAQPEPARQEARAMLKGIKGTLHGNKPAADIMATLKTLEAITDEVQRMHFQVESLLNHGDPAVRRQAVLTLAEMSRTPDNAAAAVTKLTNRLSQESDAEVREDILLALYRMGPHAISALPKVLDEFKSEDPRIRRKAILVIGNLLPQEKELMPIVISALDDPDKGVDEKKPGLNSVSMIMMLSLQRAGPAAKDAAPKLKKIAEAKKWDEFYQTICLITLTRIAPEDPFVLKIARDLLKKADGPTNLRKGAGLVAGLGKHGKDAVPELINVLNRGALPDKGEDESVKKAVLEAFRNIGPDAKEALPTLRAMRGTTHGLLRNRTLDAIKSIEGK
jgi:HEAT repeat protein